MVVALQEVLEIVPDVKVVLALIDRLSLEAKLLEQTEDFVQILTDYYLTRPANIIAQELSMHRKHPFLCRMIKDIHQIVHNIQPAHRAHTEMFGTLTLGK